MIESKRSNWRPIVVAAVVTLILAGMVSLAAMLGIGLPSVRSSLAQDQQNGSGGGLSLDDAARQRAITTEDLDARGITVTVDGSPIVSGVLANNVNGASQRLRAESMAGQPSASDLGADPAQWRQGIAQAIFDQVLYLEALKAGLEVSTAEAEAYAADAVSKAKAGGEGFDQYRPQGKSWDELMGSSEAIRTYRRMLTVSKAFTTLVQPAGGPRNVENARAWFANVLPNHTIKVDGLDLGASELPKQLR